jgi:hypothetical protein
MTRLSAHDFCCQIRNKISNCLSGRYIGPAKAGENGIAMLKLMPQLHVKYHSLFVRSQRIRHVQHVDRERNLHAGESSFSAGAKPGADRLNFRPA